MILIAPGHRERGPREAVLLALSPRHLAFVQAYLRHYNATRAVREAEYPCTYASAKVQGCRLMAREDVKKAIMYGMGNAELYAKAMSLDALEQAIRVSHMSTARPSDRVRAARMVLRIAGLLPGRRRGR